MKPFFAISSIALFALTSLLGTVNAITDQSATITYYGDDQTTSDASPQVKIASCMIPVNEVTSFFAAIASQNYKKSLNCYDCVRIDHEDRFVVVQIVDECPTCDDYALDISHLAMGHLFDSYDKATDVGMFNAKYSSVSCDHLGRYGPLSDFDKNTSVPTLPSIQEAVLKEAQNTITATPTEVRVCFRSSKTNAIYIDE